jgi:hypothetical protein
VNFILVIDGINSQVNIVTRLRLRRLRSDSHQGEGLFSLPRCVHTASGNHRSSYPMGTEGFFPEVNWPERDADHSSPPSAEVKNAWAYFSTPPCVFMAWRLVKHGICRHGLILS